MRCAFLAGILLTALLAGRPRVVSGATSAVISGPSGALAVEVLIENSRLRYRISRNGLAVIESSPLGITVDGVDLGTQVTSLEASAPTAVDVEYPWRGVKSVATNRYRESVITIARSGGGSASWQVVWRVFDDGAAFRCLIPGSGLRTVGGESSGWTLPAGTLLWAQTDTKAYEGLWTSRTIGAEGGVLGLPVTCRLPGGASAAGYAVLTEAALYGYPGVAAEAVAGSRFLGLRKLGESSWTVPGGGYTPWRVVMVTADLQGLVASTIVPNLNPEPAGELVGASWIRPGRATWSWWARRDIKWKARLSDQPFYIDAAAELDFEYVLFDDGWGNWPAEELERLLVSARDKGVGVWLWKRWTDLEYPAGRAAFWDWIAARNAALGAEVIVGVKIDFMESETQARMNWYQAVLTEAAARRLMVNFHGTNKPTGMSRTFPNHMTHEGIRGLEYHLWGDVLPPSHNAALPFTRLAVGDADYTPTTFDPARLGATTFGQQLAMALVMTSGVTHWADDPVRYLPSEARDLIEAAPGVWEETQVLPPSEIGDLAVFARRREGIWFLAMVNGRTDAGGRTVPVSPGFLGPGTWRAITFSDVPGRPDALQRGTTDVTAGSTLSPWLAPGGGFAAMLVDSPFISRLPGALSTTSRRGRNVPDQTFTVRNIGTGLLEVTAEPQVPWLSVQPQNATSAGEDDPAVFSVRLDVAALPPGPHVGTILLTAPAAGNSPRKVHVWHHVGDGPVVPPDFDDDGDVDMADFAHFQRCLTGMYIPQTDEACRNADLDGDTDVDAGDLTLFQRCLIGSEVPALPGCEGLVQ